MGALQPSATGPLGAPRNANLVRREEIWGRRSVGAGLLLVALALIGGIVLLAAGSHGNGSGASRAIEPTVGVAQLQSRFLDGRVVDHGEGISIRRPASWDVSKSHGVTNIQSKDRCLVMQLSAPVPAGRSDELRRDGVTALREQYPNARVQPGARSRIGGVPTTSSAVVVKDPKGNAIQVLLSVGKGHRNAYLTQVVVRDPSCQGDLQLAQLMLSSARFSR
jgi:hypothetical protein